MHGLGIPSLTSSCEGEFSEGGGCQKMCYRNEARGANYRKGIDQASRIRGATSISWWLAISSNFSRFLIQLGLAFLLRIETGIDHRGDRYRIEEDGSIHKTMVTNAATPRIEIDEIHAQNIETSCKQSQGSTRAPHPVGSDANVSSHGVLVVAQN
jgi:hypothetical protein